MANAVKPSQTNGLEFPEAWRWSNFGYTRKYVYHLFIKVVLKEAGYHKGGLEKVKATREIFQYFVNPEVLNPAPHTEAAT